MIILVNSLPHHTQHHLCIIMKSNNSHKVTPIYDYETHCYVNYDEAIRGQAEKGVAPLRN